ncbi:phosphocarrier protein HPr [Lentisphaera araneosa HTCC2155]|jgi:phosphocarrier protein HPr|uniref:Phosphocarrier protein HPr n=1 Tax=Lentisphaera araneosa HTCC2155 TaxID=313628 RepID=A6DL78_9BACT|nr:HPr family phosphocarrier protein [Lentisphaera araneosa]EDM27680.1 phosphocarrier protein HPr [Lentisphaera araneosa HTCC2155]
MYTIDATVNNIHGIHCRPSSAIVKGAKSFESSITVNADGQTANLTNILELISLGLPQGASVSISAEGSDEEAAAKKIAELFEEIYDYPDK